MKTYRVAFYSTISQRKAMIVQVIANDMEHAKNIARFDYDAIYFQFVEQVY